VDSRTGLLGVWLILVLATASPAAADVVGPPPDNCPNGSYPDSSHAGPTCWPTVCTSNNECTSGEVCVERALCIEPVQGWGRGGQFTLDHAVTSCDGSGVCPPGASCMTNHRCMPRVATLTQGVPASSFAIAGVVVGLVLFVLLVLVVILGAVLLKRRKRSNR
jgi:hypothetical protein